MKKHTVHTAGAWSVTYLGHRLLVLGNKCWQPLHRLALPMIRRKVGSGELGPGVKIKNR